MAEVGRPRARAKRATCGSSVSAETVFTVALKIKLRPLRRQEVGEATRRAGRIGRAAPPPRPPPRTALLFPRHGPSQVSVSSSYSTWASSTSSTRRPGWARTRARRRRSSASGIERLLHDSDLAAVAFPDLLPAQWSKLIFNATVNTVSALTDLGHVALFAREEEPTDLGHLVHQLVDEGKRVAEAAGVVLHEDPWEMNVLAVRRGETQQSDYAHVPSMLEDVRAQRPTEVDFITGALVREAERLGVPVPLHTTMYRLVKGKEAAFPAGGGRAPEAAVAGDRQTERSSS